MFDSIIACDMFNHYIIDGPSGRFQCFPTLKSFALQIIAPVSLHSRALIYAELMFKTGIAQPNSMDMFNL